MSLKRSSLVFTAVYLVSVSLAQAQDKMLVILRPAAGDGNGCSAGPDPAIHTLHDYKVGRKGDVRVGLTQASASSSVGRDEFNRLKKLKLKELTELESRNGLLYVAAGGGQKMLAVPDVEPSKNAATPVTHYMGMVLDGETRDGKAKQKQAFPLTSVWRAFVLTPSMTEAEALFRHAEQEKTVSQWTFFLGKVPSHKVKEAGEGLAQATVGCIEAAMVRFVNGTFSAIEDAKTHGQRLVAMSGGSGPASERLAAIQADEQQVRDLIRTGMELMKAGKWDDALSAWDSLTKYLKDPLLGEFTAAYNDTVVKSHDAHLADAAKALEAAGTRGLTFTAGSDAPYRKALREFEKALSLQPESAPAKEGVRNMSVSITLIDARRFRTAKDPGKAREALIATSKVHGDDARLSAELTEASCELSTQYLGQARAVTTVRGTGARAGATYRIRAIPTAKEKLIFTDALDKARQAVDLCQSEEKITFLAGLNAAFADYHVAQAKRAMTRKLAATALLHLNAAQAYQSDRGDLDPLMSEVREPVQQRSQIQAGVAITSINNECAEAAEQIAGAVESALVSAGSANIQLLARDQARTVLRQMRSGSSAGAQANHAVISGQIATCTLNVTSQRRQVPSKLQYRNERYEQLDQQADAANDRYNQCRKTYGEQPCAELKAQRDQARNMRSRESPTILQDYTYEEQPFTVSGEMRLMLQVDDTILRGTRIAGEATASVSDTCVARRGVRENDWGRNAQTASQGGGGWRGLVRNLTTPTGDGRPQNVECPDIPRSSRLFEMVEKLTAQAQTQATTALRNVSNNYFQLAKRATDADVALEYYITFALLSADKGGADYQTAIAAIRARDADLNPEGAVR